MKKALCLIALCTSITVALASEEPVYHIYRKIIPFLDNKRMEMVEEIGISLIGFMCAGVGILGLREIPAHWRKGEKSFCVGLVALFPVAALFTYFGYQSYQKLKQVFRNYRLRNVPIMSLKSDGLWYNQKFICKWEEINRIKIWGDWYPRGLVENESFYFYDDTDHLLLKLDLNELKCSHDELAQKINDFRIKQGLPRLQDSYDLLEQSLCSRYQCQPDEIERMLHEELDVLLKKLE